MTLARKPKLAPELWTELELHGVDSMRSVLASATNGFAGTGRGTLIRFGNVNATRGEIQDWLKWKGARDARWIKAGVWLALVAALAGVIAAVEGWLALIPHK